MCYYYAHFFSYKWQNELSKATELLITRRSFNMDTASSVRAFYCVLHFSQLCLSLIYDFKKMNKRKTSQLNTNCSSFAVKPTIVPRILWNALSVVYWAIQTFIKEGEMTSINTFLSVHLSSFLSLPFNPTTFLTRYLKHSFPSPTLQPSSVILPPFPSLLFV